MVCFLPVCKILDDRSSGNFRQVLLCGYAGGTCRRLLENRAYICRNNRSCLRKNCLILLMCVNRADGKIFVVTLQKLVLANELIRTIFMAQVCIHGLFGAVELAFQNVQKKNLELIFSGVLSSPGIVFSCMMNQPYACVYYFSLFLIKVLVSLRTV